MMNYPQRHKRRATRRYTKLVVLAVIAVLLLASSGFWGLHVPKPVAGALTTAAVPLWRVQESVTRTAQDFIGLLSSKRALVIENRRLRTENTLHEQEALLSLALREENEELKALLGREEPRSFVLASVLAGPGTSLYDTILIDAGSDNGIRVGDLVFAAGDIALGTIGTTYGKTSLVHLFSAPGRETPVVLSVGNVEAVAVGEGGGNFSMRLPRGLGVAEGDRIAMPMFNLNVFGVVETIIDKETEPFQTVLFKSPVNIAGVRWVEVERAFAE